RAKVTRECKRIGLTAQLPLRAEKSVHSDRRKQAIRKIAPNQWASRARTQSDMYCRANYARARKAGTTSTPCAASRQRPRGRSRRHKILKLATISRARLDK